MDCESTINLSRKLFRKDSLTSFQGRIKLLQRYDLECVTFHDLRMTLMDSSAAVLLYDFFSTIPDEIYLIWERKTTGVTVLFLLNRYLLLSQYMLMPMLNWVNWHGNLVSDFQCIFSWPNDMNHSGICCQKLSSFIILMPRVRRICTGLGIAINVLIILHDVVVHGTWFVTHLVVLIVAL